MIRKPVVAGKFYPATEKALREAIEKYIVKDAVKTDALAVILPHAGYIYSGPVAGETISQVEIKKTAIILGPNHTGYGSSFGIITDGAWDTPLGQVQIDKELAREILSGSRFIQEDSLSHLYEHSVEVEIPFLQYFKKSCKIVPIVAAVADLNAYQEIGKEIARAIKKLSRERDVLIIASSDMTHYEPQEEARAKDLQAIDAILKLDEEELFRKIRTLNISMCGFAPVIIMLSCIKELGAKVGSLVKYQTSGDVTKDYSSVVGYAGIILN